MACVGGKVLPPVVNYEVRNIKICKEICCI